MNRIIRLKNGTEIPISVCGEYADVLGIHATISMADACAAFTDPENLATITETIKDNEDLRKIVWEGYTQLLYIVLDGDQVRVGLRKENAE